MLEITPVRAFSDNYIWLIHSPRDPRQVLAVDPGDAAPVQRTLAERGLTLAGILITHHHADHVGGVAELLRRPGPTSQASPLGDIALFGPAREKVPGEPVRLREGDRVRLDELGLAFEVLDVPGHTAGHIAYVGHGAVFCGDTLFSGGSGRLFEGTPEQMTASLGKLAALPEETRVYCAHEYTVSNLKFSLAVEPDNEDAAAYLRECEAKRARDQATVPSTIGRERKVNPFLRCREQSVKQAAERRAGRGLQSEAEVLAVIRQWKDGFRG